MSRLSTSISNGMWNGILHGCIVTGNSDKTPTEAHLYLFLFEFSHKFPPMLPYNSKITAKNACVAASQQFAPTGGSGGRDRHALLLVQNGAEEITVDDACRIELFGTLRVLQSRRSVTRFGRRKAEALLAYLAYYPEKTHARDHLVALLWPDEEKLKEGRDSLSTALRTVRKVLEPPGIAPGSVLVADSLSIGLNAARVSTDVQEFTGLTETARQDLRPALRATLLKQAVGLYRGRLLADFYDEWVVSEQRYWQERYFDTLARLALALEQSGEREAALEVHGRMAEAEPLREETYRAQMRLLVDLGRQDAARTLAEAWERQNKAELAGTG